MPLYLALAVEVRDVGVPISTRDRAVDQVRDAGLPRRFDRGDSVSYLGLGAGFVGRSHYEAGVHPHAASSTVEGWS